MSETYHRMSEADRAAMVAMRAQVMLETELEYKPEHRAMFDEMIAATPEAEGVRGEPGIVGGVAGLWCRPEEVVEGAAILYLHGGAYVIGSSAGYRNLVGQIAARAKVVAFVADYRLAPEHVFPAAVEDAVAVYRGLVEAGFRKIAVVGDSAGGGLTLALLLLTKEEQRRPVAGVVLSAWTDLAMTGESLRGKAVADPLLKVVHLKAAVELYLEEQDRRDVRASPLYGEMGGLAPVLMHVGEDEILLEDTRRFGERVEEAGGYAEVHVWEGMVHVFHSHMELEAATGALDGVGEFLRGWLVGTEVVGPR